MAGAALPPATTTARTGRFAARYLVFDRGNGWGTWYPCRSKLTDGSPRVKGEQSPREKLANSIAFCGGGLTPGCSACRCSRRSSRRRRTPSSRGDGASCRRRKGRRASTIASPQTLQVGGPASSPTAGPAATIAIPSFSRWATPSAEPSRITSASWTASIERHHFHAEVAIDLDQQPLGVDRDEHPVGRPSRLSFAIDHRTAERRNARAISSRLPGRHRRGRTHGHRHGKPPSPSAVAAARARHRREFEPEGGAPRGTARRLASSGSGAVPPTAGSRPTPDIRAIVRKAHRRRVREAPALVFPLVSRRQLSRYERCRDARKPGADRPRPEPEEEVEQQEEEAEEHQRMNGPRPRVGPPDAECFPSNFQSTDDANGKRNDSRRRFSRHRRFPVPDGLPSPVVGSRRGSRDSGSRK